MWRGRANRLADFAGKQRAELRLRDEEIAIVDSRKNPFVIRYSFTKFL